MAHLSAATPSSTRSPARRDGATASGRRCPLGCSSSLATTSLLAAPWIRSRPRSTTIPCSRHCPCGCWVVFIAWCSWASHRDLPRHFPSVGGSPNPKSLADDLIGTAKDHMPYLAESLSVAPQTNETGRAAALFPAMCAAVAPAGGRIRLLEIGAAGGLNLMLDKFRYELGDWVWGPASDTATIRAEWTGSYPPDPGPLEVVSRRGCDVQPLDVTDPEQRLRLLSFVWADQDQRFERMRAAIEVARRSPPVIDRADAGDWLANRLSEEMAEATTTVVQQSVMWQYLSEGTRVGVRHALEHAGRSATKDAPLVHITFEPGPRISERGSFAITVTKWPSGESAILGNAQAHGAWVEWGR